MKQLNDFILKRKQETHPLKYYSLQMIAREEYLKASEADQTLFRELYKHAYVILTQ